MINVVRLLVIRTLNFASLLLIKVQLTVLNTLSAELGLWDFSCRVGEVLDCVLALVAVNQGHGEVGEVVPASGVVLRTAFEALDGASCKTKTFSL